MKIDRGPPRTPGTDEREGVADQMIRCLHRRTDVISKLVALWIAGQFLAQQAGKQLNAAERATNFVRKARRHFSHGCQPLLSLEPRFESFEFSDIQKLSHTPD